jgi:hypothetical protein
VVLFCSKIGSDERNSLRYAIKKIIQIIFM